MFWNRRSRGRKGHARDVREISNAANSLLAQKENFDAQSWESIKAITSELTVAVDHGDRETAHVLAGQLQSIANDNIRVLYRFGIGDREMSSAAKLESGVRVLPNYSGDLFDDDTFDEPHQPVPTVEDSDEESGVIVGTSSDNADHVDEGVLVSVKAMPDDEGNEYVGKHSRIDSSRVPDIKTRVMESQKDLTMVASFDERAQDDVQTFPAVGSENAPSNVWTKGDTMVWDGDKNYQTTSPDVLPDFLRSLTSMKPIIIGTDAAAQDATEILDGPAATARALKSLDDEKLDEDVEVVEVEEVEAAEPETEEIEPEVEDTAEPETEVAEPEAEETESAVEETEPEVEAEPEVEETEPEKQLSMFENSHEPPGTED